MEDVNASGAGEPVAELGRRKTWITPQLIVSEASDTQKLVGYGDYVYSSNTYGS